MDFIESINDISELRHFFDKMKIYLQNYDEILYCLDLVEQYKNLTRVSSNFGNHFNNCCWAYDSTESGPDTCACVTYNWRCQTLKDAHIFCKNIVNKRISA